MGARNILIPLDLMMKIADLLCYWDVSGYGFSIQCDYCDVINAILKKLKSMDLRQAYSNIISAKNEDERFDARIEYLKQRHESHS